jgi:hypothetical protein
MKASDRRPNEEPYAGKLLVRFREGLGRQLPSLLDNTAELRIPIPKLRWEYIAVIKATTIVMTMPLEKMSPVKDLIYTTTITPP